MTYAVLSSRGRVGLHTESRTDNTYLLCAEHCFGHENPTCDIFIPTQHLNREHDDGPIAKQGSTFATGKNSVITARILAGGGKSVCVT
jgi:hypothetical protein